MRIQSNGMGQQSVALYLMSSMGIIDRFDYSIFADPGAEDEGTYKYIHWLLDWQKKNNGIPIIWDKSKNLYRDILNNWGKKRVAKIPAFSSNGNGIMLRQCTGDYKINVVNKNIRKLYDIPTGNYPKTRLYFGISQEEIERGIKPKIKKMVNVYPFCNYEIDSQGKIKRLHYPTMTRSKIVDWLKGYGFPIPPKSSCIFCPFHNNKYWKGLKNKDNKDWGKAVIIDKTIRNSGNYNLNNKQYIHRSCKPINEINFNEEQTELNFDCYGYCDI